MGTYRKRIILPLILAQSRSAAKETCPMAFGVHCTEGKDRYNYDLERPGEVIGLAQQNAVYRQSDWQN